MNNWPHFSFRNRLSDKLYESAQVGNLSEVESILAKATSIDVNRQCYENRNDTALMVAAANEYSDIVSTLLNAPGIDINLKNKDHRTALMIASANGDEVTVRKFLPYAQRVDINAVDNCKNTALMLALRKDNPKTVAALLEFEGLLINKKNSDGESALILAAKGGFRSCLKNLLISEHYVGLHSSENIHGALMTAASCEWPLIVDELLQYPGIIDVNAINEDGKTPLMVACCNGQPGARVAKKLLLHTDTDVSIIDKASNTALMQACVNGWQDAVRALVGHSTVIETINEKNLEGYTALMLATKSCQKNIVPILLQVDGINAYVTMDNRRAADLATIPIIRTKLLEFEHSHPPSPGNLLVTQPCVVEPPTYIIFLAQDDFILGSNSSSSQTKADWIRSNFSGLVCLRANSSDRSSFTCSNNQEFRVGVVYQRLLKRDPDEAYGYIDQCNFAQHMKGVKLQEFSSILQILGAQSIIFEEEELKEEEISYQCGCNGWLLANIGCNGIKIRREGLTNDGNYKYEKPQHYTAFSADSIDLSEFYFRKEWRELVKKRTRDFTVIEMSEKVNFFTEVNNCMEMSLKFKNFGLDVGGDFKRTTHYTRIYKVIFYPRSVWD